MPLYDYNRKEKKSFLKKLRHDNPDAILEEDRYTYKGIVGDLGDDGPVVIRTEEPEDTEHKVDYNKRVPAYRAYAASLAGIFALAFLGVCISRMVTSGQELVLTDTVLGACSFIWACAGAVFALLSFKEKDRDYRLSIAALAVTGSAAVFWIIVTIVGATGA